MRTFFDEDETTDDEEARAKRLESFPSVFVPYSENFAEDLRLACDFFDSLNKGVQVLTDEEIPEADRVAWAKAQKYLNARPF